MALPDDTRVLISRVIEGLPVLTIQDIPSDEDSCPICLTPFASLFQDNVDDESGVTKLVACNHIFCRKDLSQWIQSLHGSCPTCRHIFLDIRTPSDSDDESSDGGEYIPDDDDDEDVFMDTDGFSDAFDYTTDDMEEDEEDELEMRGFEMSDARVVTDDLEMEDESEGGLTDRESSDASDDVDAPYMLDDVAYEGRNGRGEIGVTLADDDSDDDLLNDSEQEK